MAYQPIPALILAGNGILMNHVDTRNRLQSVLNIAYIMRDLAVYFRRPIRGQSLRILLRCC